MKIFDTHSHYTDDQFQEDRDIVLEQVHEAGVTRLNSVGCDVASSQRAIDLANQYQYIYAICGISPNDIGKTKQEIEEEIKKIEEMLQGQEKIVAIGEIGLDYYWEQENKELQKYAFQRQIQLANQLNLPIVIHTREAVMDTVEMLKKIEKPKVAIVFHCCPLNPELVKEAIKLGAYISFAGPVTFKNAKNAQQIVQMVPLDHILTETDCPYLAPEPNRGKRNDSRNIQYIIEKIAQLKELEIAEVENAVYENAMRVFKIEKIY